MLSVPAPGTQPSALVLESLFDDHTASRNEQREPESNSSAVVVTSIVAPDAPAGSARQPSSALRTMLLLPRLPRTALVMYRMLNLSLLRPTGEHPQRRPDCCWPSNPGAA